MARPFAAPLLKETVVALVAAIGVALPACGAEKYIACPQAGIEILLPDGFVPTTEPEGYLNAETGANVLVVVSDNPIEVEIAGLTHGDFGRNGIEIVEKTPLTLAGKRAILVSTQQTGANPNVGIVDPTSIAQWIVGFGDRSTVLVVA